MKGWFLALIIVSLCAGCAGIEEAYYVDREFGKAQMESWDKLIADPEYRKAQKQPEGFEGIHAEPAMRVYHDSFAEKPTETNVIQFGIVE